MINIDELIISINEGLTISELAKKFNVSVSTIKRKMSSNNLKSLSRDFKNIQITYNCIECNIEFSSKDKDRKFCSNKCSISNNMKILSNNRKSVNKKISEKLNKKVFISCKECNKEFLRKVKKRIFCSISCSVKNRENTEENKKLKSEFFSKLAKKRHEIGDTTIGWQNRNILTPSYPEKLTMDILNEQLIDYEYEKKVGKYFIYFTFNKYMIALEIDGRTHDDLPVIEKDKRKDEFLKSNGWFVYRIKWTNNGKKHYKEIIDFIENML